MPFLSFFSLAAFDGKNIHCQPSKSFSFCANTYCYDLCHLRKLIISSDFDSPERRGRRKKKEKKRIIVEKTKRRKEEEEEEEKKEEEGRRRKEEKKGKKKKENKSHRSGRRWGWGWWVL